MNENEIIAIVNAFKEGKTIQARYKDNGIWLSTTTPCWDFRAFEYRTEPKQKLIKLDKVVGTDIDCEFDFGSYNLIGKLVNINDSKECKYQHVTNGYYRKCRIRENHWFYEPHGWGKCPIPDGLEIILRSEYGGEETTDVYVNRDNWKHGGDETIIAFQVISTADDARYE